MTPYIKDILLRVVKANVENSNMFVDYNSIVHNY